MRIVLHGSIFFSLIILMAACTLTDAQPERNNNSEQVSLRGTESLIDTPPAPPIAPPVDTIHLVAVGDMMLGTDYPDKRTLPANDGVGLLHGVEQYLQPFDLTFGNLEGVIGRGGKAKSCNDPRYCYTFRMPSHYTNHLKKAGFDVVSIANNHANDFGSGGRKASATVLDTSGLHYAGSMDKPYTTFEKNGVKYGFLAAAPNSGCFSMKNYKEAAEMVAHLDSICDIVLVSFHAGAEGAKATHTPRKDEIFLGYNRGNVYKFAHDCIDAGADVLLGHGPHVTRAAEVYKDRFITYSMGNFCTYAKFSLKGPKGVGPIFQLMLDKEGRFLGGKVVSTKQLGEGIPVLDEEKQALKQLQALSKSDFPESPLVITDEGKLYLPVEEVSDPIPVDSTTQDNTTIQTQK
ncbi:MAG: CapA family protein [Aureispira sp.]